MRKLLVILFLLSSFCASSQTIKLYGTSGLNIRNNRYAIIGGINATDTVLLVKDSNYVEFRKAVILARWLTVNRPSNPVAGYFGYNIDSGRVESYNGAAWTTYGTGSGGGGGGGITSITSSNSSLTVSGTTVVDITLNTGNSNTWSADQIFNNGNFKLKDADGSNNVAFALGTNYANNRTVTWTFGDVNRTITMNGTITFPNNFIVSGNFAFGMTISATTSVTIPPGTITMVDLASTQTLTNKTITASTNVLGGVTMTLGSDANEDFYKRSAGVLTRVGIGATGAVLQNVAGSLTYGNIVSSGRFTPTLTNGANVSSSTAQITHWSRNGSEIDVEGTVSITTTSGINTLTVIDISLPVASNLAASTDLAGSIITGGHADQAFGIIVGDATNDRATCSFLSGTGAGARTYTFRFTYTFI